MHVEFVEKLCDHGNFQFIRVKVPKYATNLVQIPSQKRKRKKEEDLVQIKHDQNQINKKQIQFKFLLTKKKKIWFKLNMVRIKSIRKRFSSNYFSKKRKMKKSYLVQTKLLKHAQNQINKIRFLR